ncbi:unnamed protein product [Gadus morhua 'NCC']
MVQLVANSLEVFLRLQRRVTLLYLAAMPVNGNAGRTQARTTSGKRMYRKGYVYNLKAVVFEEMVPNPQSARRSSRISDLSFVPSSDERSCGCINISLYPRAALKTSLIWWLFWFTGNIEVPSEELEDDIGLPPRKPATEGIKGTVRSLSRRLSHGILHSLRNRTPKSFSEHRAFPRDGQQLGGTSSAASTTLQREHLSTVSDFVEFDIRTSENIPNV